MHAEKSSKNKRFNNFLTFSVLILSLTELPPLAWADEYNKT